VHDLHHLVAYARVHRQARSRVYHRWSVSHSRTGFIRDENGARTQRPSRSRAWPWAPAFSVLRARCQHAQHQITGGRPHGARKTRSQPRPQARGTRTPGGDKRATVHGHMRTTRQRSRPACCTLRLVGLARFFWRPAGCGYPCPIPSHAAAARDRSPRSTLARKLLSASACWQC